MNENDLFFDELRRDVDADHRRIDGADAPSADMWKSIRAQAEPDTNKKETTMIHSNSITNNRQHAISPVPKESGRLRHTLSLAASFLIVMSVALGGWFATMQLNQPGGSDGRFALFSQTDESATCDDEPMTVDEVMEIVENPYRYSLTSNAALERIPTQAMELADREYAEAWSFRIDSDLLNSRSQGRYNTEADFLEAVSRMNGWLDCLQTGTIGHIFRFTDPFEIQRIVLSSHPVFRDQESIRSGITDLLEMPAAEIVRAMITLPGQAGFTIHANENRDDSLLLGEDQSMRYNANLIFQIGIRVTDEDGAIVYENTANGIRTSDATVAQSGPFTVLMAKSAYNGEWYVLALLPLRA